jgi:hypothetical protein
MNTKLGLLHLLMQSRLDLATPFSVRHLLLIKDIQAALMASEWKEAAFLASTCMGTGRATYQRLLMEAETSPEPIRLQMMTEAIRDAAGQLGPPSERMKVFQRLLAEVREQAADLQERWSPPLTALASNDLSPLIDAFSSQDGPIDSALAHAVASSIGLLTYGLHADVHAEFNLVTARSQLDLQTVLKWSYVDAFETTVTQFETTLVQHQESLFHALRDADPSTRAREARSPIDAIVCAIERDLPAFVRKQAVAVAAMTPIQQSKDTDLIARLGRSLIEAGRLTREALATYAAAHYVGIGLVLPETPRTLRPVIRITGTQPFDSPTATFPTIPLTKLIDVAEGDKVEITGLITNIETPPVPAEYKPVSYIQVTDPLTQATATAIGVYVNAPHHGLAVGAWVRLSGNYRHKFEFPTISPLIEIERIPLATSAKASWRTAFLNTASHWQEVRPNELNIFWSLSPHTPADPSDMLHVGAGELIYRKPIRGIPFHEG